MIDKRGKIVPVYIEDEMTKSYLDYSMSVIISRALPDVRDGLKPSQRRILYAMHELHLGPNTNYRKCAKIAGDTSGNYHPHGEAIVYPTLVRMAQSWVMRYRLVQGQGNFGSIDGDSPAAMRYTEARLFGSAIHMLEDIDKETVDYQANYDATREEPVVLPAKFPNLLVNGSQGIAVGMSTNIPPHNIGEIIDGMTALIDNPEMEPLEMRKYVKGPDFPTAGYIIGEEAINQYFQTGRGKLTLQAKTHIEKQSNGKEKIIITEIPYHVNKTVLIEKIVSLVKSKTVEGISDIRDESDRKGMRLIIELKKGESTDVVLNKLYKHSMLRTTFSVFLLALVENRPRILSLKEMMQNYINHRHEVVLRRERYLLRKAEERAHILEGFRIALDNIDRVIEIIRASKDTKTAQDNLIAEFKFSDRQAKAILEMRLQRLTGLEREKIEEEYSKLLKEIERIKNLLANVDLQMQMLKDEFALIKAKYSDKRKTQIIPAEDELKIEDLIEDEDVVVIVSRSGYIKRMSLDNYRLQGRGGKGIMGAQTKSGDTIDQLFVATNHQYLLCFTDKGKCYWIKVYNIPEGSRTWKGKPIVNLINLEGDEKIKTILPVKGFEDGKYIVMATRLGIIKKVSLQDFSRPNRSGIIAIRFKEGDSLLSAYLSGGNDEIILVSKSGKAVRFNENDIRKTGRTAIGVIGMTLEMDDHVASMVIPEPEAFLLTVCENGFGKKTDIEEYRKTKRGAKGVRAIKITKRNGYLISAAAVRDTDEIIFISQEGQVIRIAASKIRPIGRDTNGVRLFNLNKGDKVTDLEIIRNEEAPEEPELELELK